MTKKMNQQNKAALDSAREALTEGRLQDAEAQARAIVDAKPQSEDAWSTLAEALFRQGRGEDCGRALQDAITKNPNSAALFTLLGNVLVASGQMNDAHTAFEHALGLDRDNLDAILGMAQILAAAGQAAQAAGLLEDGARKAPKDPRFPMQIAQNFLGQGQHAQAMPNLEIAVAQARTKLIANHEDAATVTLCRDASTQLGILLYESGEIPQALNYLDLAVRLGAGEEIQTLFAQCIGPMFLTEPMPQLKPLLERALIEAWTDPADLVRVTTGQIRLDPDFANAMKDLLKAGGEMALGGAEMARIAGDPLLLALMNTAIASDAELEELLTAIRARLLKAAAEGEDAAATEKQRTFALSLANQCFVTDYAYRLSDEERAGADALEAKLAKAAGDGAPITEADLITLAAYRPLHRLSFADQLRARDWPETLEPLLRQHLREPGEEAALAATIAPLTPIADDTSKAVRQQYEESPYPRWVRHQERRSRTALGDWLAQVFPHLPPPPERYRDPVTALDVLVAGCGTGRDAIAAASRFPNADVLAVDLSLASMGYALRKTRESGAQNLTYGQADILDIDSLGRQFDIVECAGVLHHLADPVAGWRALAGVTKPGGYMMMALYSQLGRRDIDPAIAFAKKGGYGTDDDSLRRFRADVLALPADNPVRQMVDLREDFFNLAMLRDLVFHVREERFTIARLRDALKELGLQFGGFALGAPVMADYAARFGAQADPASLENWEAMEEVQPQIFSNMYHFIAIKPEGAH